jgi:hypothetical protein
MIFCKSPPNDTWAYNVIVVALFISVQADGFGEIGHRICPINESRRKTRTALFMRGFAGAGVCIDPTMGRL